MTIGILCSSREHYNRSELLLNTGSSITVKELSPCSRRCKIRDPDTQDPIVASRRPESKVSMNPYSRSRQDN